MNITIADFSESRLVYTCPLYQYDYGQILRFRGVELPDAYEVHFANTDKTGESVTQIGNADGVSIPDSLLLTGLPVFAWVFLHAGANDGETEYKAIINVKGRAQPSDEVPTPVEQSAIDQAIAALNAGVTRSENAAESASASAESAAQSATEAAESASAAAAIATNRVFSLDGTELVCSGALVQAVGIPAYVDDVSGYSEYGITKTGWYIFARITAKTGVVVSDTTAVIGADGSIVTTGATYVDIAARFEVAARAKVVSVIWDATETDNYVFSAPDLAVRNLDYRTTFYIYDLAPFTTFSYALTADATFSAAKNYYTLGEDGTYTLAVVTAGEAIPADTYYNHSKVHFEGMTPNVTYKLDEIIDCPLEVQLPEVEDDGHGAWFELQLRYNNSYSTTLLFPSDEVKAGTASTQAQNAGINVVDLHYTNVDGSKLWTLLNSHSNIPT